MNVIRLGDTNAPPENPHHDAHHMGVFREVTDLDELDEMVLQASHHEISDLDGCETHMHFITADVWKTKETH